MKSLKIIGKLIILNDEFNNNKPGKYIEIQTNINTDSILELLDEFKKEIEHTSGVAQDDDPYISNPAVSLSATSLPHINIVESIFRKLKIDISKLSDFNDISVISDTSIFLELPWEEISLDKKIIVIRRMSGRRDLTVNSQSNNLIVLLSHARNSFSDDISKHMNLEVDDIDESVKFLRDETQGSFRIEKILISKHTSITALDNIDWKSYNMIHMIVHGESNGNLCFESNDPLEYKEPNRMSHEHFIDKIKNYKFKLFFASSCYSGGGVLNNGSIAFKVIEKNISDYSIGYRNPVGEFTAKKFASYFYRYLANGGNMVNVYKKALNRLYQEDPMVRYIPYLFMN